MQLIQSGNVAHVVGGRNIEATWSLVEKQALNVAALSYDSVGVAGLLEPRGGMEGWCPDNLLAERDFEATAGRVGVPREDVYAKVAMVYPIETPFVCDSGKTDDMHLEIVRDIPLSDTGLLLHAAQEVIGTGSAFSVGGPGRGLFARAFECLGPLVHDDNMRLVVDGLEAKAIGGRDFSLLMLMGQGHAVDRIMEGLCGLVLGLSERPISPYERDCATNQHSFGVEAGLESLLNVAAAVAHAIAHKEDIAFTCSPLSAERCGRLQKYGRELLGLKPILVVDGTTEHFETANAVLGEFMSASCDMTGGTSH